MHLLDAQYTTYGSSSVTHNPTVDGSAATLTGTDIVILPQSTLTLAGRIASIQFYAATSGSITIYVSEQDFPGKG